MMHGAFVWYELATTEPDAAATFYRSVIGWTSEPIPGLEYTRLKAGGIPAAGLMQLPPHLQQAGVKPHWSGYVAVDDVDASLAAATAAGASLKFGPQDVPGVGRFAVVTDPHGAPFNLFKPLGAGSPAGMMVPGHVSWHELTTADPQAAFAFYAGLFGWQRSRAFEMGPAGAYQIFAYDGADRGGLMSAPDGVHPHWLFYITVDGIDAAIARIGAAGGAVRGEPMQVPGGAWVITAHDPQGARFALVSGTR